MEYIEYIISIFLVSLLLTILISIKQNSKKIYKYIPAIIVFVGFIGYCILKTVFSSSTYIGITYTVAFIIILPGLIASVITALIFDIINYIKRGN